MIFLKKSKNEILEEKAGYEGGSLIRPFSGYFAPVIYGLLVCPRVNNAICCPGLTKRETVVNFLIILSNLAI